MIKCDVCDQTFKNTSALISHSRCHDPIMADLMREKSAASRLKATEQFCLNSSIRRLEKIDNYHKNYNTCKNCSCCMLYEYKKNTFCSSKCAATYNNRIRKESGWVRTEESKLKVSKTLKSHFDDIKSSKYGIISDKIYEKSCVKCSSSYSTHSKNKKLCDNCVYIRKSVARKNHNAKMIPKNGHPHSTITIQKCTMCDNLVLIRYKKLSKFCSKACSSRNMSLKSSERLKDPEFRKNRYGRHKRSYMEISFSEWLHSKGIHHEIEEYFHNYEINKHYFTDFYFESLKLVIELDGTQHRHTKEKDAIRDEFLTRVHGLKVVRITHRQYVKKERLKEIKNLLGVS